MAIAGLWTCLLVAFFLNFVMNFENSSIGYFPYHHIILIPARMNGITPKWCVSVFLFFYLGQSNGIEEEGKNVFSKFKSVINHFPYFLFNHIFQICINGSLSYLAVYLLTWMGTDKVLCYGLSHWLSKINIVENFPNVLSCLVITGPTFAIQPSILLATVNPFRSRRCQSFGHPVEGEHDIPFFLKVRIEFEHWYETCLTLDRFKAATRADSSSTTNKSFTIWWLQHQSFFSVFHYVS